MNNLTLIHHNANEEQQTLENEKSVKVYQVENADKKMNNLTLVA